MTEHQEIKKRKLTDSSSGQSKHTLFQVTTYHSFSNQNAHNLIHVNAYILHKQ